LTEYDQALAEFKEAYRVKPDATFLYNIAQCHRKLGQVDEALTFYRTYLRRAPDAPNRGEVERRIQELEAERQAKQSRQAEEEREARAAAESKAAAEAEAAKSAERAATLPPPVATPSPQPVPVPLSRPLPEAVAWPATPAPANRVDLAQPAGSKPPAEAEAETSILHRWWFWTAVGVVVAGGVTGALLATRGSGKGPFCSDCATTAGVNAQ
jgi:tetratricopeptide (TPR) repeat protein